MSSGPLPSAESSAEPRQDADDEAVYAEIMAAERGRSVLPEYASGTRHPEALKLVSTTARLETAVQDNSPLQTPAAFACGLADFAAAIGQIERVLAAGETSPAADVHFAAERIQDIAAALRRREVEAALCDALEAATREVGDAVVRHDAAAARAASAAALLKELARSVHAMIALIGDGGDRVADAQSECGHARSLADSTEPSATAEAENRPHAPRPDDIAQDAAANVPSMPASDEGDIGLPKAVPQTLPDLQAQAGRDENANELRQPLSLPVPNPLEGEKKNDRPPTAPAPKRNDVGAISRATSHESLTALQTLSEEELIALFG